MSKHVDEKNDVGPIDDNLLELRDCFEEIHEVLQDLSKAYIKFSQAYVKVFERIDEPKPDPNQLSLELWKL